MYTDLGLCMFPDSRSVPLAVPHTNLEPGTAVDQRRALAVLYPCATLEMISAPNRHPRPGRMRHGPLLLSHQRPVRHILARPRLSLHSGRSCAALNVLLSIVSRPRAYVLAAAKSALPIGARAGICFTVLSLLTAFWT
jgi:hypothetical protein